MSFAAAAALIVSVSLPVGSDSALALGPHGARCMGMGMVQTFYRGDVRVPAQDLPSAIVLSLGGYPRSSTGVGTEWRTMAGVNWAGYQTGLAASPFRGRSCRSVGRLLRAT